MTTEIDEKIEEMQKFIPCIRLLIENLQKDPEKEGQAKHMEYLLDMLTRKDNSIKMETLLKCESIVEKIYGREKQFISLMGSEKSKLIREDSDQKDTSNDQDNTGQEKNNLELVLDEPETVEEQTAQEERTAPEEQVSQAEQTTPEKQTSQEEQTSSGNELETKEIESVPDNCPKVNGSMDETDLGITDDCTAINDTESIESVKAEAAICNDNEELSKKDDSPDDSHASKSPENDDEAKHIKEEQPLEENESKEIPSANQDNSNTVAIKDEKIESVLESAAESDDDCVEVVKENKSKDHEKDIETPEKVEDSSEIVNDAITVDNEKGEIKVTDKSEEKNEEVAEVEKPEEPSDGVKLEEKSNDGIEEVEKIEKEVNTAEAVTDSSDRKDSSMEKITTKEDDLVCDMEIDEELTNQQTSTHSTEDSTIANEIDAARPKTISESEKPSTPPATSAKQRNEEQKQEEPKKAEKPSVVDLTSDDDEPAPSKALSTEKQNITTINLLDSDSDDNDDGKTKKSDSSSPLKMPTPKMSGQPMFTISSVQSINATKLLQQPFERELKEIVKTIEFSSFHTVPYKHTAAVRVYLEKFIRDLIFEKNRVNLCLQKLQKTVDFDRYKSIKRVIQQYCSEPVNDPTLPAPSPFCHRIKVFPEKLQWVMRQLLFIDSKISVVGYKFYSLECQINGVKKIATVPVRSVPVTRSPAKPIEQNKSPSVRLSSSQTVSPAQPKKSNVPPTTINDSKYTRVIGSFSDPLLVPSRIVDVSDTISNDSFGSNSNAGSDLLSPVGSESVNSSKERRSSASSRNRRRKRPSAADDDDDDDDDDNYVPHDPVEVTAESRRVSLQRASKARCQRYLKTTVENGASILQDIIDSSGSDSETENKPRPPRSSAPKTVRKRITPKRKVPEEVEVVAGTVPIESDSQEAQPLLKRTRSEQSRVEQGIMDDDDEDVCDPPPKLDTSVINTGKNIWHAYHAHSKYLDACLICHERTKENCLIPHYVNRHRDSEAFVSRFTKSDVTKVLSETMNFAFPTATKSSVSTFVAYCFFCREECCLSLRSWYEHYTRHTGEYVFECSNCKMRKSRLSHINKHVKSECSMQGSKTVILFELPADADRIDAYLCRLCNFVQLQCDNIIRHLQREHEISASADDMPADNYCAVNLLNVTQPNYNIYNEMSNENCVDMSEMNQEDDMSFMICNMLATAVDVPAAVDTTVIDSDTEIVKDTPINSEPIQFLPSEGNTATTVVNTSEPSMEADVESFLSGTKIATAISVRNSPDSQFLQPSDDNSIPVIDQTEPVPSLIAQTPDGVIFEITEIDGTD